MVNKSEEAKELDTLDRLFRLVASGHSVAAAGRALEIPASTANRLYHKAQREYYNDFATVRNEVIGRELKTLDMLQAAVMKDALSGDTKAVRSVLEIMNQRSAYLDLKAAAKVSVEISRVDEAMDEIVQIIDGSMVVAAELERITIDTEFPEAG